MREHCDVADKSLYLNILYYLLILLLLLDLSRGLTSNWILVFAVAITLGSERFHNFGLGRGVAEKPSIVVVTNVNWVNSS